jgi:hypothetical protein
MVSPITLGLATTLFFEAYCLKTYRNLEVLSLSGGTM